MSSDAQVDETMEAIMHATYRALCEYGYPNTSIANIAAEFEKSQSLLYYHYESKEDILTDFLTYILNRFEATVKATECDDPVDQLRDLIDRFVPPEPTDDQIRFRQAYCEIRSQAPHNETYQALLAETDARILAELTTVIKQGCETGAFRDVDPESSAEFILSAAYGIMERGVTFEDRDLLERNRRQLLAYVDNHLRAQTDR